MDNLFSDYEKLPTETSKRDSWELSNQQNTPVEHECELYGKDFHPSKSIWKRHGLACVCVLLLATNIFLGLVFLQQEWRSAHERDLACIRRMNVESPAFEAIEYEDTRFKGKFGQQSPWTGPPSPEVDAAWNNITSAGGFGISDEDLRRNNRWPEQAVRLPPSHGGQYLGSLDVFHKIHCVDMLRRNLYKDHPRSAEFFIDTSEKMIHTHLEHCIELLRQTLMCNADVSLVTFNWVEGQETPAPNFDVLHKCRNWDKIWSWSQSRDFHLAGALTVRKPDWQGSVSRKQFESP